MEPSPCGCPSQCEFNAEKRSSVQETIWHLHDVHQMTREAAAEWIGTIEDKMAEEKAAVVPQEPRVPLVEVR